MRRVNSFPDIVRDARLDTEFIDDRRTKHVRYEAGTSGRYRRLRKEELWTRSRFLGRGAYGTVYLETCGAEDKLRKRAVKVIQKYIRPELPIEYGRELEAIFKFSNARYAHCFVTADGWFENEDSVYISMEYFELGDLQAQLGDGQTLSESDSKQIAIQLLDGLAYMHDNQFVHRDLKPSNIMVVSAGPEWYVKIADFGISKRRREDVSTLHTMGRGTYGYAAPEVLELGTSSEHASYSFLVDMWSLGAVVYKLLTSKTAFKDMKKLITYIERITTFPYAALEAVKVSPQGLDFIAALMSAQPEARPPAASAKLHEWFADLSDGEDSGKQEETISLALGLTNDDKLCSSAASTSSRSSSSGDGPDLPQNQRGRPCQGPYIETGTDESLKSVLPHLPSDGRTILRTASPGEFLSTAYKARRAAGTKRHDEATVNPSEESLQLQQSHSKNQKLPKDGKDNVIEDGRPNDCAANCTVFDSDEQEQLDGHIAPKQPKRRAATRRITFYSKSVGFNDQVELTNLAQFGAMKTTCFSCGKKIRRDNQRSNELQCGHIQCIPCLERKFKEAVRDPSAMPAVCCTNDAIPLTLISLCHLPKNFREDFTRKMVEYCRKRLPCPNEFCHSDVQLEQTNYKRNASGCISICCPDCQTHICADCKNPEHYSGCLPDTGTRKLLAILEAERAIQITDDEITRAKESGVFTRSPRERKGEFCWQCGKSYDFDTFEHAQCGHSFCHTCLVGYFIVGLVMPQHNPPRCCSLEIGLSCFRRILVNPWLNDAWLTQHEMSETGSWACPTGAHFPRNLFITNTIPAVWKPKVQCDDCGPGHGLYCIRCKERWHKAECRQFKAIEALHRALKASLLFDHKLLEELGNSLAFERRLRLGEKLGHGQFRRAQKFLDGRGKHKQAAAHAIAPMIEDTAY